MTSKIAIAMAAAAIGFSIQSADATTIQFGSPGWQYNQSDQIDWLVSIDDETAGFFRVNISAATPSGSFDMLGFGFDTVLTGLNLASLTFVSSSNGEGITGFFANTLACGGGCNFNGATASAFDYIVRMGSSGSGNGAITSFEFLIGGIGAAVLSESTFTIAGIRAQGTGPFGEGSVKDINRDPSQVSAVPIPATLPLLVAGLGAAALVSRRKRKGRAA